MKLSLVSEKENKLLSRRELIVKMEYMEKTPTRKDVQSEVAKSFNAKADLTIIEHIKNEFGKGLATITVYVYDNEEVMKRLTRQNLVEKHAGHEPKKEEGEN